MAATDIYDADLLDSNMEEPEAVVNNLAAVNEAAVNEIKVWTVTATFAPTQKELAEGLVHKLSGTPAGDFTVNLVAVSRRVSFWNVSGKIATVQVTGGAGKNVKIADGDRIDLQCDGTDVAMAAPSPISSWITVSKHADETRATSAALADDSTLTFAVEASTKYRARGRVWYDTVAAADFKYAITSPAAATLIRYTASEAIAGAAAAEVATATAFPTGASLAGAGTTGGFVEFDFILHNGVNAGDVHFQWCQDTSDGGNTTVRAGSYIEWQKA